MPLSRSGTLSPREYANPPQTPPPRRPTRLGSRVRSDSSVSAIIMTPDQPLTPGTSSRPVSTLLENEQDMADLTAEMALLDDGFDTRTGRTITTRSGGGLRPLSLQYKPPPRPVSSSDSDNHDEAERGNYTPTSRSQPTSAPTFYAVGGNYDPTPLSYPEKPGTPTSGLTKSRLMSNLGKVLYRTRVVLRLMSIMGAGCVLGVLSHVTAVFMRTKHEKDPETGKDVWPGDGLDLMPTHTLIVGAAVCLISGIMWTTASLGKGIRRLDSGCEPWVRWVAGLSAAFETAVWVAGIAYAGKVKNIASGKRELETLFWVCIAKDLPFDGQDNKDWDAKSPVDLNGPVDFRLHCGEIKAAWFAAIAASGVTTLILLTIIGGQLVRWWHRRRKGKGRMLGTGFEEPGLAAGGLRSLRLAGGGKANIGGMGRKWLWRR
ncbi:hypothetical protein BGX38DRAFT_926213 [Terfezia claveryi]|nr:hypothetical protein BGX38DRAFT_926213 [Terfezia claveryi]